MTNKVISANTNEDRVVIINLAISALATERQIDLDHLGIKVEELPEASKKLLREKIFSQEFLRNYSYIRELAEAAVSAGGSTKTELGAVTSFSEAIGKVRVLRDLKQQWEERVRLDESRYDAMCAEHTLATSQAAIAAGADPVQVNILVTAIQEKQPRWEEVKSKLKFNYTATPVALDECEFDADLFEAQRDSVVAIRDGVLGSLVQFVCKEAKEMLENLQKQEAKKGSINLRVNPRTVARARMMQEKLKSLAFIHPLIRPLHTEIAAVLDKVSDTDALMGRDYLNFKEICVALCDQTLVHERLQKGIPLISVATPSASQIAANAVAAAMQNIQSGVAQSTAVTVAPAVQATASAPVAAVAATPVAAQAAVQPVAQAPVVAQAAPVQQKAPEVQAGFFL